MIRSAIVKSLLVWVVLFYPHCPAFAALDQSAKYPAFCVTTSNLNVCASDSIDGKIVGTIEAGREVIVMRITDTGMAELNYFYQALYCSPDYLQYSHIWENPYPPKYYYSSKPTDDGVQNPISQDDWGIWKLLLDVVIALIELYIIQKILLFVLVLLGGFFYKLYVFISFPFYIFNVLQRYLAKPWRPFYKENNGDDDENARKRRMYEKIKIPFYILLTPLRLLNAVYYNVVLHCSFELFNYIIEVILPSNKYEGGGSFVLGVIMIPWRIVKYLVLHGSFTLIESGVWTIVDTFVPALTLYHGTDGLAAENITQGPGRTCSGSKFTGLWKVGGGNFAGNGIYFAPVRNTACHYSSGSLIVCRVSLGRTLDLGLAPKYVYDQCGHANALAATKWGLENGYVTGEWWRKDCHWWEYCLYDWQNRYNHSWRIRPLYVLDLEGGCIQRIPGGMTHWLFRWIVVKDLYRFFFHNNS